MNFWDRVATSLQTSTCNQQSCGNEKYQLRQATRYRLRRASAHPASQTRHGRHTAIQRRGRRPVAQTQQLRCGMELLSRQHRRRVHCKESFSECACGEESAGWVIWAEVIANMTYQISPRKVRSRTTPICVNWKSWLAPRVRWWLQGRMGVRCEYCGQIYRMCSL